MDDYTGIVSVTGAGVLEGADVSLVVFHPSEREYSEVSTTTDSDGRYLLRSRPPDGSLLLPSPVALKVRREGFQQTIVRFSALERTWEGAQPFARTNPHRLDVALLPAGRFALRLCWEDGEACVGESVALRRPAYSQSEPFEWQAVSDEQGVALFEDVPQEGVAEVAVSVGNWPEWVRAAVDLNSSAPTVHVPRPCKLTCKLDGPAALIGDGAEVLALRIRGGRGKGFPEGGARRLVDGACELPGLRLGQELELVLRAPLGETYLLAPGVVSIDSADQARSFRVGEAAAARRPETTTALVRFVGADGDVLVNRDFALVNAWEFACRWKGETSSGTLTVPPRDERNDLANPGAPCAFRLAVPSRPPVELIIPGVGMVDPVVVQRDGQQVDVFVDTAWLAADAVKVVLQGLDSTGRTVPISYAELEDRESGQKYLTLYREPHAGSYDSATVHLPAGLYDYVARADGFGDARGEVAVSDGAVLVVSVPFRRPGGVIGQVASADRYCAVELIPEGPTGPRSEGAMTTGISIDGTFSSARVPPGVYHLAFLSIENGLRRRHVLTAPTPVYPDQVTDLGLLLPTSDATLRFESVQGSERTVEIRQRGQRVFRGDASPGDEVVLDGAIPAEVHIAGGASGEAGGWLVRSFTAEQLRSGAVSVQMDGVPSATDRPGSTTLERN